MLAITIEDLVKTFPAKNGTTTAVDHVSLTIPAGSLFFLLGPSGCGKTTLLRMIAGFTYPTAGRILFDGNDISNVPPHRRDTGMVFQSYALWPHMTVADNVGFGLEVRKLPQTERNQRIDEMLKLVQMEDKKFQRPNQLSGGQQQRVALARALAIRPRCLLLDEPLSNLDAKLRLEMRSEIRRIIKQAGITAIYVTHDQKEALSMADAIAVMNAGKLEQVGAPAELYRHPASRFVAGFIGESNFLPGVVESVTATTIVVKTSAGALMARARGAGASPVVGTPVAVAFRPESAQLAQPSVRAPVDTNVVRGTRLSTTYLGDLAEHMVQIAGMKDPIKTYELNPPPAATQSPGEITLQIPADQVMLVDALPA
jgi:iron(III) transport system ATP-binding protein